MRAAWYFTEKEQDLTNMDNLPTNNRHVAPGATAKVVYTVIAVLLLIIGLAGLIVPIIPGILFLLGAVLIMAKVSSRVHHWSEGQAWVRGARIRLIQMQGLKPLSKVKFTLLLGVQSVVSGIQNMWVFGQRVSDRFRSNP